MVIKTRHVLLTNPGSADAILEVDIPDYEILRLGRRYFEIASGAATGADVGEPVSVVNIPTNPATHIPEWEIEQGRVLTFDDHAAMVAAQGIKRFCEKQTSCKSCPFGKNEQGGKYGCKIGCNLNKGVFIPDRWEV